MQIVREGVRQQPAYSRTNIAHCSGLKIDLAKPFEQVVHQNEQELTFGSEMLVESAHSEIRSLRQVFDGSAFKTFLPKQGKAGGFPSRALLDAACLSRCRRQILNAEKLRAFLQARLLTGMITPTSAPAQHQSTQPPKTPAKLAGIFGNTRGKKALEKGSSNMEGKANEIAALSRCSGGKERQRRRISHAMSGKLRRKSINVPAVSPGRRTWSPATRKASVAPSQTSKPETKSRTFITGT